MLFNKIEELDKVVPKIQRLLRNHSFADHLRFLEAIEEYDSSLQSMPMSRNDRIELIREMGEKLMVFQAKVSWHHIGQLVSLYRFVRTCWSRQVQTDEGIISLYEQLKYEVVKACIRYKKSARLWQVSEHYAFPHQASAIYHYYKHGVGNGMSFVEYVKVAERYCVPPRSATFRFKYGDLWSMFGHYDKYGLFVIHTLYRKN